MPKLSHRLWKDLGDLVYPRSCRGCAQPLLREEELLCTSCLNELPRTHFHLQTHNEVLALFTGRCRLHRASSYFYFSKEGRVQELLHRFKYKGEQEIGRYLGRMMARDIARSGFFRGIDLLVPVPLHPQKEAQRGFNQSAVLAHSLCEVTGIAVCEGHLVREQASSTQTRKSRFARWENVEKIFALRQPAALHGRHLLLIDDVVTTGATVEACVQRLTALRGTRVSLLTLATARH